MCGRCVGDARELAKAGNCTTIAANCSPPPSFPLPCLPSLPHFLPAPALRAASCSQDDLYAGQDDNHAAARTYSVAAHSIKTPPLGSHSKPHSAAHVHDSLVDHTARSPSGGPNKNAHSRLAVLVLLCWTRLCRDRAGASRAKPIRLTALLEI